MIIPFIFIGALVTIAIARSALASDDVSATPGGARLPGSPIAQDEPAPEVPTLPDRRVLTSVLDQMTKIPQRVPAPATSSSAPQRVPTPATSSSAPQRVPTPATSSSAPQRVPTRVAGFAGPPLEPEEERLLTLLILWARDKAFPTGQKRFMTAGLARELAEIASRLGLEGTTRAVLTDGPIPAEEMLGRRGVTVREAVVKLAQARRR